MQVSVFVNQKIIVPKKIKARNLFWCTAWQFFLSSYFSFSNPDKEKGVGVETEVNWGCKYYFKYSIFHIPLPSPHTTRDDFVNILATL